MNLGKSVAVVHSTDGDGDDDGSELSGVFIVMLLLNIVCLYPAASLQNGHRVCLCAHRLQMPLD